MNQLPMAERAFVQVLTLNPAFHDARFMLSQVYEREGKLADALRECSYVVQASPANQGAQAMLLRLRGPAR
jgi:predicted TPR repeat methyltransferase